MPRQPHADDTSASCPECRTAVTSAQDRFCAGCGAPLPPAGSSRPRAARQGADPTPAHDDLRDRWRRPPRGIAVGFVALAVAGGALALLPGADRSSPSSPADDVDLGAAEQAEAPDGAPEGVEPGLSCTPAGCERWRADLEDRWELIGTQDGALVLLDRARLTGGAWGEDDDLRLLSLDDGSDRLRTPLRIPDQDGEPAGAARGLRTVQDALAVALDRRLVLVGFDGEQRWSHTPDDALPGIVRVAEDRILLELTATTPDQQAPAIRTQAVDLLDGAVVWETPARPVPTASDEVAVTVTDTAPEDDPAGAVLVTGHDLRDGEVLWERPAAAAPSAPAELPLLLLPGGGGDGGDVLVGVVDGAEVVDLGRAASWLGSTADGDGVLVLGSDGAAGEDEQRPPEVARVDEAGAVLWRVEVDEGPDTFGQLLARPEGLVLVADDATTVVLDPESGASLAPEELGTGPAPRDGRIDAAGRRITQDAEGITIAGDDDVVSIATGTRDAAVVHEAPYVIWDGAELVAVEPVEVDRD